MNKEVKKVENAPGITDKQLFASKLKKVLKQKKISVKKLSEKSNLDSCYLRDILRGNRCIQLITIKKICDAIDYPIIEFWDCLKPSFDDEN